MKVTKEEWKKYPTFYLLATFSSKEGATEGGGAYVGIGNVGRRDWTYDWSKERYDAVVKRPAHIAVSRPNFNFKPTGTKGESQIMTLLSEEDWTVKASNTWIHLSTSDNNTQKDANGLESVSGNATGSTLRQIMIDVDENTTGRSRVGKITFTASDGEKSVIEISQAK